MPDSFADFLLAHRPAIDARLAACLCDQTDIADVETYLYAPLARYTANGGKRHRPLICELASRAVGGTLEQAHAVAAAIEHFQSAALIHDDIADCGELRRGAPCLHRTEGTGLAINCGDLELMLVTGTVLEDTGLADAVKLRLLGELVDMTRSTIEGQALDLGWARDARFDLTIDDYLIMAVRKTAIYSGAAPLACGAIAGGGSEPQIAALRSFGLDTGLAFQIQDDLLNLIDDEAASKDARSDITEGKRTLIAVHALGDADRREEIASLLAAKTRDPMLLARTVELFEQTGSIEFARERAAELVERAKRTLAEAAIDESCRELLLSMADFFIDRIE